MRHAELCPSQHGLRRRRFPHPATSGIWSLPTRARPSRAECSDQSCFKISPQITQITRIHMDSKLHLEPRSLDRTNLIMFIARRSLNSFLNRCNLRNLWILFQCIRSHVVLRQIPTASVFDQGESLHAAALFEGSLIKRHHRVSGNRSSRGLFFSYILQIASAHLAEFVVELLKSRFGFIQSSIVTPFIRSFVVKLFVASGVNIFNRSVEHGLCRRRHAAATNALAAACESEKQEDYCQDRDQRSATLPQD